MNIRKHCFRYCAFFVQLYLIQSHTEMGGGGEVGGDRGRGGGLIQPHLQACIAWLLKAMAIRVIKFSSGGYKIRKIYA